MQRPFIRIRTTPATREADLPQAGQAHSIADKIAFHLAGIGAGIIGAASRLRETGDFDLGKSGVVEASKDLESLNAVLEKLENGDTEEAIRMLDDLGYGRVLRRLT